MPKRRMISFVWLLCVTMLIVVPSYAQNTKSADKYVKLGVWRLVRSDYDNAIADFDKALASKPDFGLAYFYRGKARQAKGDLDGAIDDYECAFRTDARIVKVAADVAEVYSARGLLRLEELNLDQAISDFDKAISLKPNQAENYFQRGTARLIDGDFNAAISDFDRCIQLHSKYAKAYLSRGVAHMHQGNKREARRDFDRCRELKHESDLMLQMYILEIETKIKERRTRRSSQGDRIASGSANNERSKLGPPISRRMPSACNTRKDAGIINPVQCFPFSPSLQKVHRTSTKKFAGKPVVRSTI